MPVAVAAKIIVSSFDLYMTYRQRCRFASHHKPSSRISALIPEHKFKRSQQYGWAKSTFQLVTGSFDTLLEATLTLMYVPPMLWAFAGRFSSTSELQQSLIFIVLMSLMSTVIELPQSIYNTFVLEARFGFNRTTVATFITDLVKGLALSAVLGLPLNCLFFYILRAVAPYNPFTVAATIWAFAALLTLIFLYLVPTFIAPLFNKFTPLSDGALKTRVEEMAKSLKFPLDKIYVIDGSRRSSHSNAFIFGLFKKYICIFDTLLDQSEGNDDGVVSIVCHELGHWQYGHLGRNIMKALVYQFIVALLYALTAGNVDLFRSFGYTSGTPVIIGLILFNEMLSPLDDMLQPLNNWLSRKDEYQADFYAKKRGMAQPLGDALVRMSIENLSNMNPDPLYSTWNYSHPTLLERLDALDISPTVVKSQDTDTDSSTTQSVTEDYADSFSEKKDL